MNIISLLVISLSLSMTLSHPTTTTSISDDVEQYMNAERARKVIGQSVVTSISVITNENEEKPYLTDAVGKTVPKPYLSPHVASPINLLNPDRYEFYTFDEKGELVKRLMTLNEIQSIVANGNGAVLGDSNPQETHSVIVNTVPLTHHETSDKKVQDIVDNIQNVLSREMENNKNFSSIPQDFLDTPNVSSSWSMILPAIFGNTGNEIMPPINMTPETEVIDTSSTTIRVSNTKRPITKVPFTKTSTTTVLQKQTPTKQEQVTKNSPTTVMKIKNKPTMSTTASIKTTTKKQTAKHRPTSAIYRSTTRKPIVSVISNDFPSIKENDHEDETTKTVLITSRPFFSTSRQPQITTLKVIPTASTTLRTVNKPSTTISSILKNKTIINKIPVNSFIKNSEITMIEMKPLVSEQTSVTPNVLSTISRTSQKPSTQNTKKETLSSKTKTSVTFPSSIYTTKQILTSTTELVTPTVLTTTTTEKQNDNSAEMEKFITLTMTMPVKKPIPEIPLATIKPTKEETTSIIPSSEEIQDLAISQIIGSLQSNFDLNNVYEPFGSDNINSQISMIKDNDDEHEETTENINFTSDKNFINNELYIEEKEPIVKDVSTNVVDTEQPSTTENEMISFDENVGVSSEKFTNGIISLENNEIAQTIEMLLEDQNKSKNKIQLEKLDVLGFDDDDETEIKLGSTLNIKKNVTQQVHNINGATLNNTNIIGNSEMTTEITTPISEESDTTIPTILSEALSNVIEQMLREQDYRKTSTVTEKPIGITKATQYKETPTVTPTSSLQSVTVKSEGTEPTLDELNKLLHHYQELSSKPDELETLSLKREHYLTTTEFNNQTSNVELNQPGAEVKSSQNNKIFSEIDTSTQAEESESTSTMESLDMETTTTDSSTVETQEFTTFFYVSDDNDDLIEQVDDFGKFTTEQFVITEKRISERKNEFDATTTATATNVNVASSEEDDNDVENPSELVSGVLNAIGLSSNSNEEDEEDLSTSTEHNFNNNDNHGVTSKHNFTKDKLLESEDDDDDESDEVEEAISSISSTLDRTLTTDIKTDFSLTSKIANSLISVADTISNTFNEGSDESEESNDTVITTKTEISKATEVEKMMDEINDTSSDTSKITSPYHFIPESSTEDMIVTTEPNDVLTTTVYKKVRPRLPAKNNKYKENSQLEKDNSSPMIQLSIIRKEDSLEEIDIVTPPISINTQISTEEPNFIKIESIETTTMNANLDTSKLNDSHDIHESATATVISSQASIIESKIHENSTERVPLIEKATKETISINTESSSLMVESDENLVQIEVQTKIPNVESNKIITSTLSSNVQNIKNSIRNQQQQHIRPIIVTPIDLSASPEKSGLATSTSHLNSDLNDFSKLCNELAFTFWKSITADGISQSRSVVISPFALTSTLSMIFLGARGQTSGEMNDLLKLDDTVTFNPHVVFRNISESVEQSRNSGIAAAAFARELYSDRSKGKLLPYFKEKAQQFYGAHVEEVNFNVINDVLRRRTNLLVKRHTYNKIKEYLKTNNVWVNFPLAAVTANIFMTDCSETTNNERDGEMFFQVSPAIRQRRLVPIPAAVYRNGFTAGYDPILDATAAAFGDDLQSTILVMPGQQGSLIPGDNLERLENAFLDSSSTAWARLLGTFMERPGLEVQIPRFSHRSLINTTYALQQMGLKDIFDSSKADLRGLTGAATSDLYFSDLIQINQFTTCGEDKIGDLHHIEIYPSPALKKDIINEDDVKRDDNDDTADDSSIQYKSLFYDPIYDSRYLNVPLSLRPRQARLPENPRLRFDRPFLYFVRHNPTGIILFMGRFNPRLLP